MLFHFFGLDFYGAVWSGQAKSGKGGIDGRTDGRTEGGGRITENIQYEYIITANLVSLLSCQFNYIIVMG